MMHFGIEEIEERLNVEPARFYHAVQGLMSEAQSIASVVESDSTGEPWGMFPSGQSVLDFLKKTKTDEYDEEIQKFEELDKSQQALLVFHILREKILQMASDRSPYIGPDLLRLLLSATSEQVVTRLQEKYSLHKELEESAWQLLMNIAPPAGAKGTETLEGIDWYIIYRLNAFIPLPHRIRRMAHEALKVSCALREHEGELRLIELSLVEAEEERRSRERRRRNEESLVEIVLKDPEITEDALVEYAQILATIHEGLWIKKVASHPRANEQVWCALFTYAKTVEDATTIGMVPEVYQSSKVKSKLVNVALLWERGPLGEAARKNICIGAPDNVFKILFPDLVEIDELEAFKALLCSPIPRGHVLGEEDRVRIEDSKRVQQFLDQMDERDYAELQLSANGALIQRMFGEVVHEPAMPIEGGNGPEIEKKDF